MGRETLCPAKAPCPSVGECQGEEVGGGGWVGGTPIETGGWQMGQGIYGVETRKGENI